MPLFSPPDRATALAGRTLFVRRVDPAGRAALTPICLAEAHPHGQYVLLVFEGVSTPEAARLLCNGELLARREDMWPPQEGEFLECDLMGLAVCDTTGAEIGTVAGVIDGSAHDFLSVKLTNGKLVPVPIVKQMVLTIDLETKRVTVDLPLGLTEL